MLFFYVAFFYEFFLLASSFSPLLLHFFSKKHYLTMFSGMLAGVLASMIESIGNYYACAKLRRESPPPRHAVIQAIGIEGIGCVIAGTCGSGSDTTSYNENILAIGITKVGSRCVIQLGWAFMLLLGILGKFGALFAATPEPIIEEMFWGLFGMILAVGLSNLQYVDLISS